MLKYLMPLVLFAVMAVFLALGLNLNPRDIPSPLIDQPAPGFALPVLGQPERTLNKTALMGDVWLLNVWASWCGSCRMEHPVFNQLAKKNLVTIVGLNYKDEAPAAKQWLAQLGNPYNISIMDQEGRTGIDYGVYGVPETFVIDKKGIIRYKHTGPVEYSDMQNILIPLIKQLKAEKS
ncbi:MAG: DsbE family thiol:disulfide interchange protein [Methylomarinum sp.]|nr:DsbE family thiol:disulfide interchange protein [Methylomarinum sp.]